MKLVLFYNPKSGDGSAAHAADVLERSLRRGGHESAMVEAFNGTSSAALEGPLSWADALIVLGGDGTVHSAADAAIAAGTPVYQFPMGTENLFAREFRMDRRPATLLRALEQRRIQDVDVASCNGKTFLLMCSVGPDAAVIHRLARVRSGKISHLSYLRPIIQETLAPTMAPMTVTVDGRRIVEGRRGLVVVANSRQYALRVDPARRASMDDGLLDVVFFPARTPWGIVKWMIRSRFDAHRAHADLIYEHGASIRIESAGRALPVQLDGEAPGIHGPKSEPAPSAETPVSMTIAPRRLRVLTP